MYRSFCSDTFYTTHTRLKVEIGFPDMKTLAPLKLSNILNSISNFNTFWLVLSHLYPCNLLLMHQPSCISYGRIYSRFLTHSLMRFMSLVPSLWLLPHLAVPLQGELVFADSCSLVLLATLTARNLSLSSNRDNFDTIY